MPQQTNPDRRYLVGTAVTMVVYAGALAFAVVARDLGWIVGPVGYLIALLPALAIVGQLVVTLRYLAEADEFIRSLTAKRFIIAASLMMALATLWGFLETFAGLNPIPVYLVYPTFWGCYGITSAFVKSSRASSLT